MSRDRSAEYSMLCLDIFLLSNDELHEQIGRAELITDPEAIFLADVTYGEWEFLLLLELEFREMVGLHAACGACAQMVQQLLEEQL